MDDTQHRLHNLWHTTNEISAINTRFWDEHLGKGGCLYITIYVTKNE